MSARSLDLPAKQQAEQQPEGDAGDQHGLILRPAGSARRFELVLAVRPLSRPCLNGWRSLGRLPRTSTGDAARPACIAAVHPPVRTLRERSSGYVARAAAVNAPRSGPVRADRTTPDLDDAKRRDRPLSSDPPSPSPTPKRSRHDSRAARSAGSDAAGRCARDPGRPRPRSCGRTRRRPRDRTGCRRTCGARPAPARR